MFLIVTILNSLNTFMRELNAIVLLLAFFVYVVHRRHRKRSHEPRADTLRDTLSQIKIPPYLPYALAIAPLYLGYDHIEFPKIFEHGMVLYILFLAVRTLQLVNNPKSRPPTDFTSPATVVMMLLYVYHGIIGAPHVRSAYLYMIAQAATVLIVNPYVTTSSLIDDAVLAHFLFYIFK
jgi:hypothetical protein